MKMPNANLKKIQLQAQLFRANSNVLLFGFVVVFFILGCTASKPQPIVDHTNLYSLFNACERLSKCSKGKFEIVHVVSQPHAPYACALTINGSTRYFYPDQDTRFPDFPMFGGFQDSVALCEMLTQTGEYSPKALMERKRQAMAWLKSTEERKRKAAKSKNRRAEPAPTFPIREIP
jgi:hypothetical protein